MERRYVPSEIEEKWQSRWQEQAADRELNEDDRPKWYFLLMYPYPSGPLHCGHWFMYAPPDAKARYLRMKGFNVFFPMGFDAFGLPAENAAIKRGVDPKTWTYRNIEEMRKAFRKMGGSFDWDHSLSTCDPEYYKWTQWLFLKMHEQGLAYRTHAPVDWCPTCNTTLAREQVVGEDRRCERCETPVIKKKLNQWLFRITEYAEELLDFSEIDWPEAVKTIQTNWIGRSVGADLLFRSQAGREIKVFTTRPDTVFGATFVVLAPEHPLVEELTAPEKRDEVRRYVQEAERESEIDRQSPEAGKSGVFIGSYAVNPATQEKIPIYTAKYVLMQYGTGAIMAVPAHDQRDFEFARIHGLPIPMVIEPPDWDGATLAGAYVGEGRMVNSGQFDGMPSGRAIEAITRWLEERGAGKSIVRYRLRDWLISRQRFWGAPIPIVYCDRCGIVPVPEKDLPVVLPEGVDFMPTGESPLRFHEGFRKTRCPRCGGDAERETDTMDTFVDSSWYWFRYLDPHYEEGFMDPEAAQKWLPVDEYAGGVEHAAMHLLYARFFTKALRDMGYLNHGEPFLKLFNQGLILGEDGEKMSKSRGNVIDPNHVVDQYGADVFRTFLMFIGPWIRGGPWSAHGIEGVARFYQRVWRLIMDPPPASDGEPAEEQIRELQRATHQTIRKVGRDIEKYEFNTAVAALMEFVNTLTKVKETPVAKTPDWKESLETLTLILAPFGPHVAEELWEELGRRQSVHRQQWPAFDRTLAAEESFTLVVQVNGRLRDRIEVPVSTQEQELKKLALQSDRVQKYLQGKPPERLIYVPGKLVNLLVR